MAIQLSIFGPSGPAPTPPAPCAAVVTPEVIVSPLRPYQREAVDNSIEHLDNNRSTLVVMPTGSGKTRVMTEIARRKKKSRILLVAHRDELLQQARQRFAHDCGEAVGLDKAESLASDERIVVASIQTISQRARLERWPNDHFDLIMVDEAHHAPAETYRRVIDYFSDAKVLGVTATPDRADEKAMGQVFDTVAFLYEIEDAIRDGWLCDIAIGIINIAGIDLSSVHTVAGDLNQGELDSVMKTEENLIAVADATMREAGDRKTLVFTTSVENAHRMAEIMNRYRAGCARAVDGETEIEERRLTLAEHQENKYQFLCNCGIATEGYDDPSISCIAVARPTKSRALYAQMVGRGLRILAGKADCLVLDFVGNHGKHQLACALDILGGNYTDEQEQIARELVAKNPGMRGREALDQAKLIAEAEERKRQEAARRAAIKAKAIYTRQMVDPFAVFHMNVSREVEISKRFGGKVASDKQLACLEKFGIPVESGCTSQLASKLIGTAIKRREENLATFKQLKVLQRAGINEINISFDRASSIIDALANNRWKPLQFAKLDELLGRADDRKPRKAPTPLPIRVADDNDDF